MQGNNNDNMDKLIPARDSRRSWLMFAALLALYLATHFVLRLLFPQTLELDEAEQMVLAQQLALGYSVQPPLYTWLQWGTFQLFGPSVLSLALLKYSLLAITFGMLYLIARKMLPTAGLCALAVFSLLLIPSFAWESLRDLTHSVLVTAIAVSALYSIVRLGERGRQWDYVMLGVLLGLGVLSKYSFAIAAAAMLLAVLGLPAYRQRILHKRFGLTLLAGFVVVLPHLIWMFMHREPLMAFIVHETGNGAVEGYWNGVMTGLGSLAGNMASFLTPLWLVFAIVFGGIWRQPRAAGVEITEPRRFVGRFLIVVLLLLAVAILGGVTRFQERWFQPLLVVLPLAMFGWVSRYDVPARQLRRYAWTLVGFAALVVVGRVGQIGALPWFDDYTRLHLPSKALAAQLRSAGFEGGVIVADSYLTGGNLRLFFPDSRVVVPGRGLVSGPDGGAAGPCLVVWDASDNKAMSARLAAYLRESAGAGEGRTLAGQQVKALLTLAGDRWHTLAYLVLEPGGAGCV